MIQSLYSAFKEAVGWLLLNYPCSLLLLQMVLDRGYYWVCISIHIVLCFSKLARNIRSILTQKEKFIQMEGSNVYMQEFAVS